MAGFLVNCSCATVQPPKKGESEPATLTIFLLASLLLLVVLVLLTEAERGTGYCFFLLRFCPLHYDASVMVVDCAAVETGCMLENKSRLQKIRVHFYCLVGAADAAAHNISTEAERVTGYCFFLLRLRYCYCCFLCVYSIAVAVVEKGYVFVFGSRCCCC